MTSRTLRVRLDVDFPEFVSVEGDPLLERTMLVVGIFIRPYCIRERSISDLETKVVRRSFERAFGRRSRWSEPLHSDIGTRKVITLGRFIFIDSDRITRISDDGSIDCDPNALREALFSNLVLRPFLVSG